MVYSGSRCFQDNANIWAKTKRAARKSDNIDPDLSQFVCKECGQVCLSSAGLTSHRRSHAERPLASLGTTKEFLGVEMSLGDIKKLSTKDVEKYYLRYQIILGKQLSSSGFSCASSF